MPAGELFVLSAPSGTGKTTLIRSLLEGELGRFGQLAFSVSHTTRSPRAGEVDGRDYHFVDEDRFHEMIVADQFLEWEEVHNRHYGTAWSEVRPRLEAGVDVIMDIDVKGAERVLQSSQDATGIFIMPPSYEALAARLAGRRLDDQREVANRLAVSRWEIRRLDQYDYVIINDDARRASETLAAIIQARRHRTARMKHRTDEVLEDFRAAFARDDETTTSE